MTNRFNVIVVGAGPSGSSAAKRCAEAGLKTLLLDKESMPRYKVCGGGLTENTLSLLGFALPDDLIEGEFRSIQVRYGLHKTNIIGSHRLGIFVSRSEFDAYLVKKAIQAGAIFQDNCSVSSVEVDETCAKVKCGTDEYLTDIVIGADGAYSIVARNVRPRLGRDQIGIGCDIILERDEIQLDDSTQPIMQFGDVPYGYAWIFPRRHYLGVGIGGAAKHLLSPKENLKKVLSKWGVKRNINDIHWYVLPSGGYQRNTCTNRIMLVGDAAGYVDPLLGGGIEIAIKSGILAADEAMIAINQGDCRREVLSSYQTKCDAAFGKSLGVRLKLTNLMHRYPKLLIQPLAMSSALTNLVFAGEIG